MTEQEPGTIICASCWHTVRAHVPCTCPHCGEDLVEERGIHLTMGVPLFQYGPVSEGDGA